jgi:hypothetical protein
MKPANAALSTRNITTDPVLLRLVLFPGEVYRLPEAGQRLRVTAGQAWLTAQGNDVVLEARETAQLPVSAEVALVSAVGAAPLMVELLN